MTVKSHVLYLEFRGRMVCSYIFCIHLLIFSVVNNAVGYRKVSYEIISVSFASFILFYMVLCRCQHFSVTISPRLQTSVSPLIWKMRWQLMLLYLKSFGYFAIVEPNFQYIGILIKHFFSTTNLISLVDLKLRRVE